MTTSALARILVVLALMPWHAAIRRHLGAASDVKHKLCKEAIDGFGDNDFGCRRTYRGPSVIHIRHDTRLAERPSTAAHCAGVML